jgi:predicted methyltransferase
MKLEFILINNSNIIMISLINNFNLYSINNIISNGFFNKKISKLLINLIIEIF